MEKYVEKYDNRWLPYMLLISLLLGIVCGSCVTINLERKLSPDIKQWYDKHWSLMETKVPKWVDENDRTEKMHFLRIPEAWQREYMKIFWEIRYEGAKETFYNLVEEANKHFSEGSIDGWRSDRGRLLVLCGVPSGIQMVSTSDIQRKPSNLNNASIEGYVYQIWDYFYRGNFVRYYFEYKFGHWRLAYQNIRMGGLHTEFEEACKQVWAPKNWQTWASILKDLVNGQKE